MGATNEALSREYALKNNLTPNGKEVTHESVRGSHLYRIRFVGGGELPQELGGTYTSIPEVQSVISSYLRARWGEAEIKKEKASAKAA